MPEYICSSCGNSFDAEPDQQGQIVCSSCGAVQSADTAEQPLQAGTRIGGYEIIKHIAAGGSGSVYLAEQLAMERKVALKILNRNRVSREEAEKFLEEARTAAKFEHPHVVSVIDSGISPEGCCYFAMQYVEGETLEEILHRGRAFSEDEALIIVLTIADALRSVWNKYKMFHKDIKPANIMLTPEKEAMLLDMGIAQKGGESKLADGSIEGSPYYMSPEQARGEELTWSTDLYSLGATLYQMVTGKYLYDGENVESILRQHDSAPFPDPAVRVPEMKISLKMTMLLQRMLEKKPSDRYSSWDEFIGEAKSVLETILDKKGSSVSSNIRKQYQELSERPNRQEKKFRPVPGPARFISTALLIFILAATLLGGVILYLAIQKNSRNARILLEPIRKQVNSLQMNPDAMDEVFRKAEPYFDRLGVLPSIRQEFRDCRKKAEEFRENLREEEKNIISLESRTAECLQTVEQELKEAKKHAAENQAEPAFRHLRRAYRELGGMMGTIRKTKFLLLPHAERAQQLMKRLKTAQNLANRENQLFRKKFGRPHPRPERSGPPPARPARVPDAKAVKPAATPTGTAGRPPVPKKASAAEKRSQSREKAENYRKVLEQEKNRIRAELILQGILEKFQPDNPVWQPKFERQPFPELNRKFDQWVSRMKQLTAQAAVIWNTVYDSHQKLAGSHFTISTPKGDTIMELRTILHDNVFLFHAGMPNVKKTFAQLPFAEWMDFLRETAKRKQLQPNLDSYWLVNGCFFAVRKNADPFILRELPVMRALILRYLSGKEIPGVPKKNEKEISSLIEKNQVDPEFARLRAKTAKPQTSKTAQKTQRGAE